MIRGLGEVRLSTEKLKTGTLAAFAAPSVSLSALALPLVMYLPPYYTAEVGLGLAVVGMVFMIVRLVDVATDPVVGVLSDRLRTPWGRRRPLIAISVPILLLGAWQVFFPPDGASATHLFVWMLFLSLGTTGVVMPHMAWSAELSDDYNERTRIQGWLQLGTFLGIVLVLVLPAVVEQLGGHGLELKVHAMGAFVLATLIPTLLVTVLFVKEPPRPPPPTKRMDWRQGWRAIRDNRYLRRVLSADLASNLQSGIGGALFIFFANEVYGAGAYSSVLLLVFFITALVFTPLWMHIAMRIGKHKTMIVSAIFIILVVTPQIFFPKGDLVLAFVATILYGIPSGAAMLLMKSMMADVIDADEAQVGERRSGLFFALLTLTSKFGGALAVGLAYPLLQIIGFDPAANGGAGDAARMGLIAIYVGSKIITNIALVMLMLGFDLDHAKQAELRQQITAAQDGA